MELLIIVVLLFMAAETTYITINLSRKNRLNGRKGTPIFVDTSVLIDGRIIAIAQSGFITSTLYIPRSVVGELQYLADNADAEKRTRARHGLDVVNELQAMSQVNVSIFADSPRAEEGVDNRLLTLAKKHGGAVCTIDFNLNKVAQVEGIQVLNVNDLAKNLRMAYLPGETTKIQLTQKGNDSHQGVGHLPDGTMVVVEQASSQIGKLVDIEFIRGLQTAAGRMMFARIVGSKQPKQVRASEKVSKAQRQTHQVQPKSQLRQNQHPQQNVAPKKPQNRPQQRRRGPEDSLIELVNKQQ